MNNSAGAFGILLFCVVSCCFQSPLIFHSSNRGDDLGDLKETKWPDAYVPKEGLGDLTGEFIQV